MVAYTVPNSSKTCTSGHTSTVPVAKLTCFCGASYPLYVNLVKQGWVPPTLKCAYPQCGVLFEQDAPRQKYHHPDCRKQHYYEKNRKVAHPGLTTGTSGAIGELRVATDLLAKGHDVFRSMSANCWTDLVVYSGGKFLSVEVKTGHRTKTGKLRHPRPKTQPDILAVVLPDEIVYKTIS